MFEYLVSAIKNTVEYQNWGWNSITVSVLGIVVSTFVVAIGLWRQNKNVWGVRSGESLSVVWFAYIIGMSASAILYGFHINSIGMVFNCAVFLVMNFPILVGLWRYKVWNFSEKVQTLVYVLGFPIVMVIIPNKEAMLAAYSVGMIYAVGTQPWEMWNNKSAGVVDARFIVYEIVSVTFWSIFAFSTGALALMILNPVLLILFLTTFYLWYRYRTFPIVKEA